MLNQPTTYMHFSRNYISLLYSLTFASDCVKIKLDISHLSHCLKSLLNSDNEILPSPSVSSLVRRTSALARSMLGPSEPSSATVM